MSRRRTYTDEQKAEALALYAEVGPAEAARRTGIAAGTIASWASRTTAEVDAMPDPSVATARRAQMAANVEAAVLGLEERKARLAAALMDDIERVRKQLWAPTVERKAMTVNHGNNLGSSVEIVDIDRDQPTFADQRQIMTTLAIAVDKVQILTGAATERIEHRHSSPIDEALEQLSAELERQA